MVVSWELRFSRQPYDCLCLRFLPFWAHRAKSVSVTANLWWAHSVARNTWAYRSATISKWKNSASQPVVRFNRRIEILIECGRLEIFSQFHFSKYWLGSIFFIKFNPIFMKLYCEADIISMISDIYVYVSEVVIPNNQSNSFRVELMLETSVSRTDGKAWYQFILSNFEIPSR